MNFSRQIPKSGIVHLDNLTDEQYCAFCEIIRQASYGRAPEVLSEGAKAFARNIAAGLGIPLPVIIGDSRP